jgi:hypothetical protein
VATSAVVFLQASLATAISSSLPNSSSFCSYWIPGAVMDNVAVAEAPKVPVTLN